MERHSLTQLYNFTGRTPVITGDAGVPASEIACALAGRNADGIILL